jgi:hypothetical protein
MAAAIALCALAVFVALLFSVIPPAPLVGLVPLGGAVWLITKSPWSRRARITASVTAVAVTVAATVALLLRMYSAFEGH